MRHSNWTPSGGREDQLGGREGGRGREREREREGGRERELTHDASVGYEIGGHQFDGALRSSRRSNGGRKTCPVGG